MSDNLKLKQMAEAPSEQLLEEIRADIFSGKKIQAIKKLRKGTGLGLAEAKKFTENLAAETYKQSPEKFSTPPTQGAGCSASVFCLLLVSLVEDRQLKERVHE